MAEVFDGVLVKHNPILYIGNILVSHDTSLITDVIIKLPIISWPWYMFYIANDIGLIDKN